MKSDCKGSDPVEQCREGSDPAEQWASRGVGEFGSGGVLEGLTPRISGVLGKGLTPKGRAVKKWYRPPSM